MDRVYLCIDLKSFYASVECVERNLDPLKYNLVVADKSRGRGSICLAITPSLKKMRIKNRCRLFEIPKNINYIIAKPRMAKYIEYSANIYSIYLKYIDKDDIHVYSIDEAFLDVTNYLKMYRKNAYELVRIIINDIYSTTGITATAGIGTNLYLAKIALDIIAKHSKDNIGYLDIDKYKRLLWHYTPLADFWRIGRGISKRLNKLGLNDMYDIAHTSEAILYKEFGINARFLIDHSKGIEPCTIKDIKNYKSKSNSISSGQILFENYNYKNTRIVLTEMIDNLVLELIKKNLVTDIIHFNIGYAKEDVISLKVSKKLECSTNSYRIILKEILNIYDKRINKKELIRRINISFSNVREEKFRQLDIFNSNIDKNMDSSLEKSINIIKDKYGKNSILRGVSYLDKATGRIRNNLIGGHNAR